MNENVVKDLLLLVSEFIPPCHKNCGRPSTRSTSCSCPIGETYYCDECDIDLTMMATFKGWRDLQWANTIRNAYKALQLHETTQKF